MKNEIELELTVPNQTCYLRLIGRIGEDMARELDRFRGDREALAHHLNMVLTEATANAIRHANAADPEKKIRINIKITNQELSIKVFDSGQGFNLDEVPEPPFDLDPLMEKGRGIFIIRSLMDSVVYRKARGGNVLVMKKQL
ncbi:MAG: anti-sigma factor [Geobacteraceae bacterium GWC2_48_7]|nr:MAG: anti-sigma factor [Geobacteraceae bacterium GWC2_48_7]